MDCPKDAIFTSTHTSYSIIIVQEVRSFHQRYLKKSATLQDIIVMPLAPYKHNAPLV